MRLTFPKSYLHFFPRRCRYRPKPRVAYWPNTSSLAVLFSCFDSIPACDGQTDGRGNLSPLIVIVRKLSTVYSTKDRSKVVEKRMGNIDRTLGDFKSADHKAEMLTVEETVQREQNAELYA